MIIRNNYVQGTTNYTAQKTQPTVNKDEGKHFCQDCYHRHLLMGGQDKDTDLVIQMAASKVSVTCDCDCHNKAADLAEPLKNALDKAKEENSFFNKYNLIDEMKDKAKDLAEQLNSEEYSDLKNASDKVKEENSFFNKYNLIDEMKDKAKDLAEQLNSEEYSDLKNALDKAKEENSFFNKDNWLDEMKNKAQDKAKDLAEQLNSEENKKNEQQEDENQYVIPNALRPKIDRNNKNLFLR